MLDSRVEQSEGRIPPNDLEAEAAVLSACILSPAALDEVASQVKPEHFYADAHRFVYEALLGLHAAGRPRDLLTLKSWLSDREQLQRIGGVKYLAEISDAVPAIANIGEYVRIVLEKWRMRQVITACQQIAAEGFGPIEDVAKWVDSCESRIYNAAGDSSGDKLYTLREAIREAYEDVSARVAAKKGGGASEATTGIQALDRMIGGLRRGGLHILMARPGMGKTSLALNIATHVAQQSTRRRGVFVASLETRHTIIALRINCSDACYPMSTVVRGDVTPEGWTKLTASAGAMSRLPIIIKAKTMSLQELRSYARRARSGMAELATNGETPELGLVIVDYLQLIRPEGKRGASREQEVSAIARGLQHLANDLDVPVLALSQLSRAVESRDDKRPRMSDARDSGEIEQAADTIMAVYRDEYYDDESQDAGTAEIAVLKSKDTETGTVKVAFRKEWMRFYDLERRDGGASGYE